MDLATRKASDYGRNCLGGAAISVGRDIRYCEFILNALEADGWFRKKEGPATGYGLMIRSIKVTSIKPEAIGDYWRYKVKITSLPSSAYEDDKALYESDLSYLYIHNSYWLSDVLGHIESNKEKWKP